MTANTDIEVGPHQVQVSTFTPSGRALAAVAVVLTAWGLLLPMTPSPSAWRLVVDVVGLGGVHLVAVLMVLRGRLPGASGAVIRASLAIGLGAFAVAAVLGGATVPSSDEELASVLECLHLLGQAGIAVAVLSLVVPLPDRLLVVRIGLDTVTTALGVTAVVGTLVLAGAADASMHVATQFVLVLCGLDVLLVAVAVALFCVVRRGRSGVVSPLLAGSALLLAAELVRGYSVHNGGPSVTGPTSLLMAGACLVLAGTVTRPATTSTDTSLLVTDPTSIRSNVLPFAGTGATLLAVIVAEQGAGTRSYVTPLAFAAAVCLAVVALRFLITIRIAKSALDRLQEALTDPMTGLLNRRGLADRLDRWLGNGPVTLVAVDLDGFRRINEEAGREIGDRVLCQVADLLSSLAHEGTIVARIDGDDFALACAGGDTARAAMLASTVRNQLGRTFHLDRHRLHLNANVGTAISHAGTSAYGEPLTTDDLLRCADQALADAQASTGGSAVHDPDHCGRAQEAGLLTWVDDLHAALAADDQLLLHFQPQHRIDETGTGTVATLVGCEALLRWQHPTHGLLGPTEVLRAAENGHLTDAVAERVLDLALSGAAHWWTHREVPVAVNLSATDLDDELLPHRIVNALNRHGLPPRALTVEVVEDTLMLDPDRALQTLTALRSIGLRIAVDDYGTGYSSLAYLHKLPIDEVKFDRSLTAGISHDPSAAVIVGHSIRLAHDLGLSALAEGIEEPADLSLLHELGCDAVQGYLTGRPMPHHLWQATLTDSTDPARHHHHQNHAWHPAAGDGSADRRSTSAW